MKNEWRALVACIVSAALPCLAVAEDQNVESWRDCASCPPMVAVPAGRFMMGTAPGGYEAVEDTGESPQVPIEIRRPFAIARHEITRQEFAVFAAETEFQSAADCRIWRDGRWSRRVGRNWENIGSGAGPAKDDPVACVSWHDARAYAAWLAASTGHSYRLPSEAEWEYAARGRTEAPRWWGWNSFEGVSISLACEHANVYDMDAQAEFGFPWPHARCRDGAVHATRAGRYAANPYGLFDMIGNVWEWTEDCFTVGYKNRPPDARAWVWDGGCEHRVTRGGSWASRPLHSRATNRGHRPPESRDSDLGFRVVRGLTPGELARRGWTDPGEP